MFEEVSLSTRDIPRILFLLNLHTRQPLRTEQLENLTEKPSNNYMNVSRNFSAISCQVTVAGVFGSFPKNHCVAKAICESFRDSYLLAIFIQ